MCSNSALNQKHLLQTVVSERCTGSAYIVLSLNLLKKRSLDHKQDVSLRIALFYWTSGVHHIRTITACSQSYILHVITFY